MECITTSDTGILKGISFRESTFTNISSLQSLNPKTDTINCICWADYDKRSIFTAHVNSQIKRYDLEENSVVNLFETSTDHGQMIGIRAIKDSQMILTASQNGHLSCWRQSGEKVFELKAGNNLTVMADNNPAEFHCATAGKEIPIRLWDMRSQNCFWESKNVRPDHLMLRVPIWDKGLKYLHDSQCLISITQRHQIRMYDPRAQRRPVKEIEWLEDPLSALDLAMNNLHIIVGNTKGELGMFDLRGKVLLVRKYKGNAGCIPGIVGSTSWPYFACCSTDRFVRLYKNESREPFRKIYCKSSLRHILFGNSLEIDEDSVCSPLKYECVEADAGFFNTVRFMQKSSANGEESDSEWDLLKGRKRNICPIEVIQKKMVKGGKLDRKKRITKAGENIFAEDDENENVVAIKKRRITIDTQPFVTEQKRPKCKKHRTLAASGMSEKKRKRNV